MTRAAYVLAARITAAAAPPQPPSRKQLPIASPPQPLQQAADVSGSPSRPVTPGDVGVDLEMTPQQRESNAEQGARDFRVMLGELQDVLQGDADRDSLDEDDDGARGDSGSESDTMQPGGGGSGAQQVPVGVQAAGRHAEAAQCVGRDSVAHRIESLRMFLEKMVGDDLFIAVYKLLDSMGEQDDEEVVMSKATAMLGPKKIYLSLVNQLIYCEDVFYDRVR